MHEKNFEVIVLGAGTAGCVAAHTAAKNGLGRVALVDRKPREKIGRKVCGDGIGTAHIMFLIENGFPIEEDIISCYPETLQLVSPDKKHIIALESYKQLAIINRHEFGQALLSGAMNEGITLFDKAKFTALKRRSDGVKVKLEIDRNKEQTLSTTLVIDATGFNSRIRNDYSIFGNSGLVKDEEQYSCYREICEVESPGSFKDSAVFEFSFEASKGGYAWVFQRDGNEFNMGIGIPRNHVKSCSPKSAFENYLANQFMNRRVIDGAGGIVPTRHPLPTHVKDNIILTGDAGAVVNPLHGGGLGAAIASGYIAGNIAARQVPAGEVMERDLWPFNLQLMQRYGLRYSVLDLFRILLQNISDEELNDAFSNDYLPLGEIYIAREYDQLIELLLKLRKTWEQLSGKKFNRLPFFIERVHEITSNYPESPDGLDKWTKKYEGFYSEYQMVVK
ncbi:MAG: NAD(P)/FAD-dependent oxidoreductase [Candidatus Odinarchaeota archaeon]